MLGLLDFQKSLTYFATGLKANELVLERLQRVPTLHWADQDQELLDDVRVELRQAIEMVDIADHVLSDMMDAFASIVSNNLNSVMKVLTSVTIILAVPTLIASVYGMNVGLPGAHRPAGVRRHRGIERGDLRRAVLRVPARNWLVMLDLRRLTCGRRAPPACKIAVPVGWQGLRGTGRAGVVL